MIVLSEPMTTMQNTKIRVPCHSHIMWGLQQSCFENYNAKYKDQGSLIIEKQATAILCGDYSNHISKMATVGSIYAYYYTVVTI